MSAVDGTAVDGQDYNVTTNNFTLASGENATYEIDIVADNNCEIEEEYFTLVLKDSNNTLLETTNSTVNVTISSDFECGKTLAYVSMYIFSNPISAVSQDRGFTSIHWLD